MPCYRCGVRQSDPDRGASPWKRGVHAGTQILICPACQQAPDWAGALDTCPRCGSVMLVRRLGETECRGCGSTVTARTDVEPSVRVARVGDPAPDLATEVEAALDRLFHRQPR